MTVDHWKVEKDHLYDLISAEGKIALKALERGLRIDSVKNIDASTRYVMLNDEDALFYQPKPGAGTWLAKLTRELKGEVSLRTIDKYLDKLLDERILRPPVRSIDSFIHQIMERVVDENGQQIWVRSYYVSNEHALDLLFIYKATHRFTKSSESSLINPKKE